MKLRWSISLMYQCLQRITFAKYEDRVFTGGGAIKHKEQSNFSSQFQKSDLGVNESGGISSVIVSSKIKSIGR